MSASGVESQLGEAHRKSRLIGLISNYFFPTPTRLADGLGTKDYPRVTLTLRPRFRLSRSGSMVPPRRFTRNGFGDRLFNTPNIATTRSYFQGLDVVIFQKVSANVYFIWRDRSDRATNKRCPPLSRH